LSDLATEEGVITRTLQHRFDQLTVCTGERIPVQQNVVVVMDVTRFTNIDGLFLVRSNQQNLHWFFTASECIADYVQAVEELLFIGHHIVGFVVDGKPGVITRLQELYPHVPCQYCQFHQIKTIKKYIPYKAQSEAARSLRSLVLRLTTYHSIQFETALMIWRVQYDSFFTEKAYRPEHKRQWRYTHEKLRSAYRSLKRNLPYLFTYEQYPTIHMPNTTNSCDGYFSHLKERLSRHRGLSKKRKIKMIHYLLENWSKNPPKNYH
jgi:hypothetical protein